jgi:hypothetical protein
MQMVTICYDSVGKTGRKKTRKMVVVSQNLPLQPISQQQKML